MAAAPRKRFDVVAYLKLFRFPLVFTAIADSAAGHVLGQSVGRPNTVYTVPALGKLALMSAGLYLFGMALNDLADRKKDQHSAPNKVLPSGRVSLRGGWIASLVVLAVSLGALVFVAPPPTFRLGVVWILTLVAIGLYDLGLGKYPPVMGVVRALNFSLGIVALGDWKIWEVVLAALPEFIYVTSLTYVSTLEDTALNRRRLGWGVAGMGLGLLLAGVLVPAVRHVLASESGGGPLAELAALASAWLVIAWLGRRAWKAADKRGVMLLVRDGVACIILLNAIYLASVQIWIPALAVASLIVPAALSLALFKRLA
jgi:4-hydroxybenzoate polyprenyltransferase